MLDLTGDSSSTFEVKMIIFDCSAIIAGNPRFSIQKGPFFNFLENFQNEQF